MIPATMCSTRRAAFITNPVIPPVKVSVAGAPAQPPSRISTSTRRRIMKCIRHPSLRLHSTCECRLLGARRERPLQSRRRRLDSRISGLAIPCGKLLWVPRNGGSLRGIFPSSLFSPMPVISCNPSQVIIRPPNKDSSWGTASVPNWSPPSGCLRVSFAVSGGNFSQALIHIGYLSKL